MRIRSILFFHARKFDHPTNLLLSLQNDVILIDSDIDIKILTRQVKMLLNDEIFNLMPFVMMMIIEDVFLMKMFSISMLLKCDPFFKEIT